MSIKIKSETIYRIDHLPGEEIDPDQELDQKQSYREFDKSGKLLLEIAYTQDGEIADKIEYRYDEAGRLLETLVYGEDDEVLERKEELRDHDGRIIRQLTHYLDGSADIHEYFFDDHGNLTGMQVKDDEDELELSEKYFYEDDRLVKIERSNDENEVIFRQEDSYVNGLISTRKIWSSEEEEPFTVINQFNAAGLRVQELRYNSRDQLIERNIYEEDDHGRVIRIIEENRQRKNTTEFSFDDQGNVVRQVETDLNGDLNHEVFRVYSPEGDLLQTTVEAVIKSSGMKRAYSLIFRREVFQD
jgi:antitoxin component YwqK of YwqJK toxin-antitoxin module